MEKALEEKDKRLEMFLSGEKEESVIFPPEH